MGNCFFHGNGGTPLNFKVVGNPQPTNPRENTIWLNTTEKITGYYFQAEPPSNMQQGEVFILVGANSSAPFNALKKNGITVYPLRVKQMISGTLKDIDAKIYQKGKWVSLTYLVSLDAINWDVVASSDHSHSISNNNGALIVAATNYLTNIYVRAEFYHKALIDVSNYNTLEATCSWNNCTVHNSFSDIPFYVCLRDKNLQEVARVSAGSNLSTSRLDIRNLTGEHYVCVNLSMGGSASVSATIEKIELL